MNSFWNNYDYFVYAVHYTNNNKTHIQKIKAFKLNSNDMLSDSKEFSKNEIISLIDTKSSKFATIYKNSNGHYNAGKEIITYSIENDKYIKTERNEKKIDNLGELIEY